MNYSNRFISHIPEELWWHPSHFRWNSCTSRHCELQPCIHCIDPWDLVYDSIASIFVAYFFSIQGYWEYTHSEAIHVLLHDILGFDPLHATHVHYFHRLQWTKKTKKWERKQETWFSIRFPLFFESFLGLHAGWEKSTKETKDIPMKKKWPSYPESCEDWVMSIFKRAVVGEH